MIWAIADSPVNADAVIGALQGMQEDISLVYFGSDSAAIANKGIAKVYTVSVDGFPYGYGQSLGAFLKEQGATTVAVPATIRWRSVAAQIAVILEAPIFSGVMKVENSAGIILTRMVYGGAADRKEKLTGKPIVITVGLGIFTPTEGAAASIEPLTLTETATGIVSKEFKKAEGEVINLNAASRVVGVGRGFPDKASLTMAEELATAIDGVVGCTRPVAEGLDWMTKDRYIGSTGAMLNASVYIACGVSGQIQHMSGALGCKTIFAINKDADALIFKHADYGLIGTVEDVLPKLVAALK